MSHYSNKLPGRSFTVLLAVLMTLPCQFTAFASGLPAQAAQQAKQDKVKVSGIVRDENGAPFGFVDVFVEGGTTGTLTDADGRYEIEVEKGQTLVFNFLGYEPYKVKVENRASIDVAMRLSSSMIEETVVVAFGE